MQVFAEFLKEVEDPSHRERLVEVLAWVEKQFPDLVPEIKWNQPIFTDHGTFIIGFSISKNHLAVSPETAGIDQFAKEIVKAGYGHTKQLFRIPWDKKVDYTLLKNIIDFNMMDKMECSSFWR